MLLRIPHMPAGRPTMAFRGGWSPVSQEGCRLLALRRNTMIRPCQLRYSVGMKGTVGVGLTLRGACAVGLVSRCAALGRWAAWLRVPALFESRPLRLFVAGYADGHASVA
jgi:hypothetical protein